MSGYAERNGAIGGTPLTQGTPTAPNEHPARARWAALVAKTPAIMRTRRGFEVRHGTTGYRYGCRCHICKEANRRAQLAYQRARGRRPRKAQHGTTPKYASGCRCAECCQANRDEVYRRRQRARALDPRATACPDCGDLVISLAHHRGRSVCGSIPLFPQVAS